MLAKIRPGQANFAIAKMSFLLLREHADLSIACLVALLSGPRKPMCLGHLGGPPSSWNVSCEGSQDPAWGKSAAGGVLVCRRAISAASIREIAPELTGHGLPLSKCEAYNRVYDQFYQSR